MGVISRARRVANRTLGPGLVAAVHVVARRGADGSPLAGHRCLVLAPHPDDETLGCGATIAAMRWRGTQVCVVVASDGRHSGDRAASEYLAEVRADELRRATAALGVGPGDVVQWPFEDGTLSQHRHDLVHAIADQVERCDPDVVLVTASTDPHPDHAALGIAARHALRDSEVSLFEYFIWGWAMPLELSRAIVSRGNDCLHAGRPVAVPAAGTLWDKRRAIACYTSQLATSAGLLGLPSGSGPLEAAFVKHFLRPEEVFVPVKQRRYVSGVSSQTGRPAG